MRGVLIGTPSGAQIPLSQVAKISFTHGPAMIRDEDGALTGYIYIDLKNSDYGGFVAQANKLIHNKLTLPANSTFQWSGEYELELRARQRLQLILPIVFFVIFLLLYLVFHSVAEALVLIFPTIYAMSGGLLLQWLLHYNFSVAVAVGYIALFGIVVETGVVMVVYLHEALEHKLQSGSGGGGYRRRCSSFAAKADDRLRCACQSRSDPLGIRHRLGRNKADCRA